MNKRELAGLACKILGVYLIIQGITVIANILVTALTNPNQSIPISNVLSSFILLILFGSLLWGCSDWLAAFIAGGAGEAKEQDGSGITPNDVQRIAFSVLGLYLLGKALPNLLSVMGSFLSLYHFALNLQLLTMLAHPIIEFLVGLGIFLGSSGLVNLLSFLRTGGVKGKRYPEDEDQEDEAQEGEDRNDQDPNDENR